MPSGSAQQARALVSTWRNIRGEAAPGVRPTAMGLFNLCYLLGVAFGPAIAAPAVG